MIYCVVPHELADELYGKLTEYYAQDPKVEVIIDRRQGERRDGAGGGGSRHVRDRRRARVPGDFLSTDAPAADAR